MYPPDHCHTESHQSSGQMKEGVWLWICIVTQKKLVWLTVFLCRGEGQLTLKLVAIFIDVLMSHMLYLLILFSTDGDFESSVIGFCPHLWAVQALPGRQKQRRPGLGSGGGWRSPGWSPAILRTHEGTGTCAAPSHYRTLVYPLTALTWDTEKKEMKTLVRSLFQLNAAFSLHLL